LSASKLRGPVNFWFVIKNKSDIANLYNVYGECRASIIIELTAGNDMREIYHTIPDGRSTILHPGESGSFDCWIAPTGSAKQGLFVIHKMQMQIVVHSKIKILFWQISKDDVDHWFYYENGEWLPGNPVP